MRYLFYCFLLITLAGCAGAQADKETHVTPEQSIQVDVKLPDVTETTEGEEGKGATYNFYAPIVSVKQEMKVEDSALKGGNQGADGGTATPRTDLALDVEVPDKVTVGPDVPIVPTIPLLPTEPEPTEPEPTEPELGDFPYKIPLRQGEKFGGGKWGTWLDRNGDKIEAPFIFSFPECGGATLTVENPSEAWGADGNPENHQQMFYFSGHPAKQDDFSMACSGGCASIFAPQECKLATYALSNRDIGVK